MKILQCNIGNTELLELYGYEPYRGTTVRERWRELCTPWTLQSGAEISALRQIMLQIHDDLCPDDKRWRYH